MTDDPPDLEELGELLQEFVNRVSHLQGNTLSVLTEEAVTLQQVLLLRRLQQSGQCTPSELADLMRMSPPAMSQMIDRLFGLDLVTRTEAPEDRRRKQIAITPKARALLQRVRRARASEYAAGVARLAPRLRADLLKLLRKALHELPEEAGALAPEHATSPTAASSRD